MGPVTSISQYAKPRSPVVSEGRSGPSILLEESVQAGRADFFFAFENELHVVAEQAFAHHVFERFHLYHGLSFVIVRSACPNTSVAYLRLERLAFPKFQRLGGHHVVMGINEYGRRFGADSFFGIH